MRIVTTLIEKLTSIPKCKSETNFNKKTKIVSKFNPSKLLFLIFLILIFEKFDKNVFAQDDKDILAVVSGKKITLSEIESLIPAHYVVSEPEQLYKVRSIVLNNYIIKILLEEEADKRKISVESLRNIMTSGRVEIPNEKVEKEYSVNSKYFGLMSPDEAKERIRLDLENEEKIQLYRRAITKLKEGARIEIRLKEYSSSEDKIIKRSPPSKGSESAEIVIIEYADFRCPYCKESQETLKKLLVEFKDDVKLIYKHLPLQTDLQSLTPAIAANCAEEQGYFWEFHDNLFSAKDLSRTSIKNIAAKIKLDSVAFETCLTSEKTRLSVLGDLKDAVQLGITGTPAFVINGKIIYGKLGFSEFSKIIEKELESARKKANK